MVTLKGELLACLYFDVIRVLIALRIRITFHKQDVGCRLQPKFSPRSGQIDVIGGDSSRRLMEHVASHG